MISTVAFANYRSLREFVMPLSSLTVVTGANGAGKSNVYRGLRLLSEAASGGHRNGLIAALAREGGLQSVLWAGPERGSVDHARRGLAVQGTTRSKPVRLKLGFSTKAEEDAPFGLVLELGLPIPGSAGETRFALDPQIKTEAVFAGEPLRKVNTLVSRSGSVVRYRGARNRWSVLAKHVSEFDSMLDTVLDPVAAPELAHVRSVLRAWRFYDHLRTDEAAPARRGHVGTRTPVLSDGGDDLAAALQTVIEVGDAERLADAIDDAFPGASLVIESDRGLFQLALQRAGLLRPLAAPELSDGTLCYLMLLAALLSPRPPALLVLNEPETSLHPELMPPLARMIATCDAQVIVVTHSAALVKALEIHQHSSVLQLETCQGETQVAGLHELDKPPWRWTGD